MLSEQEMKPTELEQAKRLLVEASHEIKNLRKDVEHYKPKAEAYDVLTRILKNIPDNQNQWATVDIARSIDRFLNPPAPTSVSTEEKPVE